MFKQFYEFMADENITLVLILEFKSLEHISFLSSSESKFLDTIYMELKPK